MAIGKEEGRLYEGDGAKQWLTDPLMKGFRAPSDEHVPIERKVITPHKRVMVLNALDFLYGHVLLKLWNAQYYFDVIPTSAWCSILPKSFEWQVPKGVAEVWLVDQKLSKAHGWYRSINEQVKSFLTDFEEVYLAKGYAHPDKSKVDIERFTGVKAFDSIGSPPPKHVTFVLREDRLWFRTSLHKLKYRALQWLGLKARHKLISCGISSGMAMKALRLIRKLHPEVTASIVGLGRGAPCLPASRTYARVAWTRKRNSPGVAPTRRANWSLAYTVAICCCRRPSRQVASRSFRMTASRTSRRMWPCGTPM
ncbi:MAG: hypothetical protein IPI81_17135 [Flavobacteriales bacterium]|nr:hypothetical protein [Flavobacteriales bacterium]